MTTPPKRPRAFGIEGMTDVEFDAFLDQPRECSKCAWKGKVGDFPMTRGRGLVTVRKWCATCLANYYRDRKRKAGAA